MVAFESPRRVGATLALLAEIDPERPVAVCRELTKLHEEVVRGSAAELARKFAGGARGEVTLVIGRREAEAQHDLTEAARRRRDAWSKSGARTARGRPGRVLADRPPGQPALPSLTKRRRRVRIAAVDTAEYRQKSFDIWEAMAEGWDRRRDWMWQVSRPVGESLVRRLDPKPGQTILELAPGPGETGFVVARELGDDGQADLRPTSRRRWSSAAKRGVSEQRALQRRVRA